MPAAQLAPPDLAAYKVLDPESVSCFLDSHPALRPILAEAPGRIERAFGRRLDVRLKLFRDHEEPSAAEIVVEIVAGGSWESAEEALGRLHQHWLAGLPRDITRNILFVTEPL